MCPEDVFFFLAILKILLRDLFEKSFTILNYNVTVNMLHGPGLD